MLPRLLFVRTLVVVLTFAAIASVAPHAAFAEGTYYYSGLSCYNATTCGGTEFSSKQVPGDPVDATWLKLADAGCSSHGYQECNVEATHYANCPGGDIPGQCTEYGAFGYSTSDGDTPGYIAVQYIYNRLFQFVSSTAWYALSDVTATLSASPTSIHSGGQSTLTWSSQKANSGCSISGIGSVAANGTQPVSPSTTTTYTLTCTGVSDDGQDTGTTTATATVTVSGNNLPDLIAGGISPTQASIGMPVTLSALITNQGSASTGTGFDNLFQEASDANGDNASTIGTYEQQTALAAGANAPATLSYTFTAAGTYYVRACADLPPQPDGIIQESNENNNCGAWTPITVSSGNLPDLTAEAPSTENITLGQQESLSALIENIGDANAVGDFPNIFELSSTSQDFSGYALLISGSSINGLAQGASAPTSAVWQPLSVGTYYVRACADNNTDWQGTIVESNENNNCGPVVSFVVAADNGPVVSCLATPATANVGQSVTWTAASDGFSSEPSFTWSAPGGTPASGSGATFVNTYAAANPLPYTTEVLASNGTQEASGYCSVFVSGSGPGGCSGTPTPTISASPNLVDPGGSVTVAWSAVNVTSSCVITGSDGFEQTDPANSCAVADKAVRTIETQTTYCIECDGNTSTKACTTVNVVPNYHET